MSFAQSGSSITQTGTDTDLTGLVGVTGVTTTVVGQVTVYIIASNNLVINGTLTMDPQTEQIQITSTTVANSLNVNTGTFNIGSEAASSYGTGGYVYPRNTALILGKSGPGCCSAGSMVVGASGTLNWYGGIINVNGVWVITDGATVKIRQGVLYAQNVDGNMRIRCSEGTNIDIEDFETYGIQFDWLTNEAFGTFEGFKPLDKGIPIENATGTGTVRAWRVMPDNLYAADALMNNWQGNHDVRVTLAEVGSKIIIVPDSTSSTTAHGGRLYHEYTIEAKDVLNAAIASAETYLADYDNGLQIETDTYNGGAGTIDGVVSQVIQAATAASGVTALQTLMTAFYYRTNSVGDLSAPDGQEKCDYRGKSHAILAAVTASSGVTATITSSDSSLPILNVDDRFILEDSTSNDGQIWEVTNQGTAASVNASRLNGNSTNETENAMKMVVLGEDHYDAHVFSYLHLQYKFTDAVMKGLAQTDLVATMLEDPSITETTRATVAAYTAIQDLGQLYDRAKDYKVTQANVTKPSLEEQLIAGDGATLDLGDLDLVLDGDTATAFAFATDTITIGTGGTAVITQVGATEAVSTGEDDEISIDFPVGIQDDDVAYIIVGHAQSDENAWNTPAGWTIPTGLTEVQTGGTPASVPGVSVFRRVLSSDSGSVTITNAGTNTSGIVAQMIVYRNVDTTTPEDVTSTTASGATGDPNPASITPTNNGSMILAVGFQDDGDQTTPTQPSGYTAINDTATLDGAGTGE